MRTLDSDRMRVTLMRLIKALALALCLGGPAGATDLSRFSQRVRDMVAKMVRG